jgi:hypothetical protein
MSLDPTTPHGRIVFNACLTAPTEIDPATIDEENDSMRHARAHHRGTRMCVTGVGR